MYCSYFSALDDTFYLCKLSFCIRCQARFRDFDQMGAILFSSEFLPEFQEIRAGLSFSHSF